MFAALALGTALAVLLSAGARADEPKPGEAVAGLQITLGVAKTEAVFPNELGLTATFKNPFPTRITAIIAL